MARTLTTDALAELAKVHGTEPLNIIEIQWHDETLTRYADKEISGYCQGKIMSIDTIDEIIKVDGGSSTAQISFRLNDADGSIKELLDKYDVHKRPCIIKQYFDSNSLATTDAFSIFRGQLVSPIVWDEHTRIVTFTALTQIVSIEAGFSPEEGQFKDVSNDLIGSVWPLCFGDVIHVPAVKSGQTLQGTTLNYFGFKDPTLSLKKKYINNIIKSLNDTFLYYMDVMATSIYAQFEVRLVKDKPNSVPSGSFRIRTKYGISDPINISGLKSDEFIDYIDYIPGAIASNSIGDTLAVDTPLSFYFTEGNQPIVIEVYDESISGGSIVIQSKYNAAAIELSYAELIVKRDTKRQEREDRALNLEKYNKQIDKLREEFYEDYKGLPDNDPGKKLFIDKVKKFDELRDGFIKDLQACDADLRTLKTREEQYKTDVENIHTMYSFIGDLRTRIQGLNEQYYNLQKELQIIANIEKNNQSLNRDTVVVNGGERFPQTEEGSEDDPNSFKFSCQDVVFKGYMIGRKLKILNIEPKYIDITLDPRNEQQEQDFQCIWLEDKTLNLDGYYLLCNDGIITKVDSQTDNKLNLTLSEVPQLSKRFRKARFQVSPKIVKKLRAKLADSLVGDETDDEILYIASYVPYDLNENISRILYKVDSNTYRIQFQSYDEAGHFTIIYDEFETTFLKPSDSIEKIQNAMVALPIFVKVKDAKKLITVTKNDEEKTIDIKFDSKLGPLKDMIIVDEFLGSPIKTQYMNTTPAFAIAFNVLVGESTTKIRIDAKDTAATIRTKLLPYLGNKFTVTGGPLGTSAIKIDHYRKLDEDETTYAIVFDSYIGVPGPQLALVSPFVYAGIGKASATLLSEGAHVHTRKEIDNILKDSLTFKAYSKQYTDIRTRMKKSLEALRSNELDPEESSEVYGQLSKDIDRYVEVNSKVSDIGGSDYYNAYKTISDEERKLLMKLEVLAFLELYRSMQPLVYQPEDPATKYYYTGRNITMIKEASKAVLPRWVAGFDTQEPADLYDTVNALPSTTSFLAQIGDNILLEANYQEKYICNILPSTIYSVYGERTIDGVQKLVPLPSRYYTKNLSDNYGRYNCTSISLKRPLREYVGENWGDKIYVSLTSSVGPDMTDIVTWIAQNYTDLSVSDFASLKTQLTNFPCNFALFDKKDALSLIEEICWQSRCLAYVENKVLKIRYLSEEPDTTKTLDLSDIENGSLTVTFSETEEIVTKLTALWRQDYYNKENKVVLRYNINKYGEQKREYDFYIYNNRDLVLKSATFWLIRKANTWKIVEFNTFVKNLDIQSYDAVLFAPGKTYVANDDVKCLVESSSYNSDSLTISVRLWCPVRAGEMEPYKFAWPAGLTIQDIFPTVEEVVSGVAGNYINSQVPNGISYDPLTTEVEFRPKDYGTYIPSDDFNTFPKSSIEDLEEFDYKDIKPDSYAVPPSVKAPNQPSNNGVDRTLPSPNQATLPSGAKNVTAVVPEPFIGRVLKLSAASSEDVVTGAEDVKIEEQRYEVQKPNGEIVVVRQMQCAKDDTIPYGMAAYVIYDSTRCEYQMQVPVWMSPNIPDIDQGA